MSSPRTGRLSLFAIVLALLCVLLFVGFPRVSLRTGRAVTLASRGGRRKVQGRPGAQMPGADHSLFKYKQLRLFGYQTGKLLSAIKH